MVDVRRVIGTGGNGPCRANSLLEDAFRRVNFDLLAVTPVGDKNTPVFGHRELHWFLEALLDQDGFSGKSESLPIECEGFNLFVLCYQ
jgi:hypothetical protein